MRVLVVNAGSSSLKLSVLDGDEVVQAETVSDWDGGVDAARVFVDDADFDAGTGSSMRGGP